MRSLLAPAKVIIQEEIPAGRGTLLENLYTCVQGSDAVLHIIGRDAGHRPTESEIRWALAICPGIDQLFDCNVSEISYTQWECYFALYSNIDCYIFVADDDTYREPDWASTSQSEKSQEAHIERLTAVGKDFRSPSFNGPDDLVKHFERALTQPHGHCRMAVRWPKAARPATKVANRHEEIDSFVSELLRGSHSVMLVEGESGDGKSTLLAEFERIANSLPRVAVARADFRGTPDLDSILDLVARRLSLVFRNASLGDSHFRGVFLKEVTRTNRPLVILFDTYEEANTESKRWIEDHLLECVRDTDGVRFVIAGKMVPEPGSLHKWGGCTERRNIGAIEDHSQWLAYANSLGLNLTDHDMQLLVSATYGRPSDTSQLIHNLADQQPQRVKNGP